MKETQAKSVHAPGHKISKATTLRIGLKVLGVLLSALYITNLFAHFWIKDRIAEFALIYYATPLPMLVLAGFVIAAFHFFTKQHQLARLAVVLALICLISWPLQSFSLNWTTHSNDQLKLFFWNIAQKKRTDEVIKLIEREKADIIGIVESGIKRRHRKIWEETFPEYHVEFLRKQMLLLTKGKIIDREEGSISRRGFYHLFKISLDGKLFTVLLIDIKADPPTSRAVVFEQLEKIILPHRQERLIVMGDFNTPLQSVHFERLRKHLDHAFEAGGNGFAETWPSPFPLLTIDHIWVSPFIEVQDCTLKQSSFSDHRAISATVNITENPDLATNPD
ncbi:MAG: endonuclease/exonuclease/phosphatase family protein [Deferribacteres bacterium]|nr:endonuclease/exonuclease/phosphatase family protein [candidate division KSB1 bacterium]MCB9508567.1 endonuclease/exonuclease/phosphatase family protein [Deferribacteres bacterium]